MYDGVWKQSYSLSTRYSPKFTAQRNSWVETTEGWSRAKNPRIKLGKIKKNDFKILNKLQQKEKL